MPNYLPVIAAFLLLFCGTHAMAFEGSEGKALGADGSENAATLYINGTKFEDSNKNAVSDVDERGISGWVIRLKLDGREISSTTTDEPGFYSFTNLAPGNYTVTEDQQAGWEQSFPGGGCYIINVPDKNAYKVDFGNFMLPRASSRHSRASDENIVDTTGVREPPVPDTSHEYPVMRVTPKTLEDEGKTEKTLPKAHIDPKIDATTQCYIIHLV